MFIFQNWRAYLPTEVEFECLFMCYVFLYFMVISLGKKNLFAPSFRRINLNSRVPTLKFEIVCGYITCL